VLDGDAVWLKATDLIHNGESKVVGNRGPTLLGAQQKLVVICGESIGNGVPENASVGVAGVLSDSPCP